MKYNVYIVFWNKRAIEITKKYHIELYDYFEGLGLINEA